MSQANVEVVRRIYDAFSRNDPAAAWSLAHAEVVVTLQRGPNAGTHRGLKQTQALFDDVRAAFESWVFEPSEIFEDGDRVVVIVKNRLRPVGTEGEIEFRNGHIWTIRDGLVVSLVGFPSPGEALKAAGLSE
jgi:ketosteroid isomerase-like protein